MINRFVAMTSITLFLFGCATPQVVEKKQLNDVHLSCSGIEVQIAEAESFEKEARGEKGVTGTNVAAAIFFWPAMFATYSNANEAIEAAVDRKEHLQTLYAEKGCDGTSASNTGEKGLSEKIVELNELYKQGILSEEEYEAAKRKALGL
jgi:hypothetical protein